MLIFRRQQRRNRSDSEYEQGYRTGLVLAAHALLDVAQASTDPWAGAAEGEDAAEQWVTWLDAEPWMSLEQLQRHLSSAPAEIRDPDHPLFRVYEYWQGIAAGLAERRRRRGRQGQLEAETSRQLLSLRACGLTPGEAIGEAVRQDEARAGTLYGIPIHPELRRVLEQEQAAAPPKRKRRLKKRIRRIRRRRAQS